MLGDGAVLKVLSVLGDVFGQRIRRVPGSVVLFTHHRSKVIELNASPRCSEKRVVVVCRNMVVRVHWRSVTG